jgi:hypothetical protein
MEPREIVTVYTSYIRSNNITQQQRISTFSVFLVLTGLLINATIMCISNGLEFMGLFFSVVIMLFATVFFLLEKRNARYLGTQCQLIRDFEIKMREKFELIADMPLLYGKEKEVYDKFKNKFGYARMFSIVFAMVGVVGFVFGVVSVLGIFGVI